MPRRDDQDEAPGWEGPGEHDRHLMDDDPSETVACAHCGKQVWAHAQRCHHCGVHFAGEAWQFRYSDPRTGGDPARRWTVILVVLVLLGFLVVFVGLPLLR